MNKEYPDQQKLLHELRLTGLGKWFEDKKSLGCVDPFYAQSLESIIQQAYEVCSNEFPVFYQHTLRELCLRVLERETLNFSKELETMQNDDRYRRLYLDVQATRHLKITY